MALAVERQRNSLLEIGKRFFKKEAFGLVLDH